MTFQRSKRMMIKVKLDKSSTFMKINFQIRRSISLDQTQQNSKMFIKSQMIHKSNMLKKELENLQKKKLLRKPKKKLTGQ